MAHKHSVYDTDNHFVIDGVTRAVKNASQTKTMLVQRDHNSERFTFEIPRYVDGHDMSVCNAVQIHYINIDSATAKTEDPLTYSGVYEVADLDISPESEDVVICSWLVSGNATQYVGNLSFVIRFACASVDGTIDYVWNTAKHSNIFVTEGIYNGDVTVEEYADILEQWRKELFDAKGVLSVNGIKPDYDGNVNINADNIFIAEYGVTTNQEIYDAAKSKKICFAVSGNLTLLLTRWDGSRYAVFSGFSDDMNRMFIVTADVWSTEFVEYIKKDDLPDVVGTSNVVTVNITYNMDVIPPAYSADMTFAEMVAARGEGKSIVAFYGGRCFTVTGYDPVGMHFGEVITTGRPNVGKFLCTSGDVWTYSEAEIPGGVTDDHINDLIDEKLAAFTNVAEVGA